MDNEHHEHLQKLTREHERRLHVLEQQAAQNGIDTRPHVVTEINDLRGTIARLKAQIGLIAFVLPPPVPDFKGRKQDIERISTYIRQQVSSGSVAVISSMRGMGGIGKTELALMVARQLADMFVDGQLLIEMRGASGAPLSPELALQTVIYSYDSDAVLTENLSELRLAYLKTLARKRVLILADDVKDHDQVKPLLPPVGCTLLITSRQRFPLPGMQNFDFDMLLPNEAEEVLQAICPRCVQYASELAKLCGYLPLALRVSASLLETDGRNITRHLERLRDERTRLDALRDPEIASLDVEASLGLSYDALSSSLQDFLVQIVVLPANFDLFTAEEVLKPLNSMSVEDALIALRRRSLLEWNEKTEQYGLHDLVRAFAIKRGAKLPVLDLIKPDLPSDTSDAQEAAHQMELLTMYRRTQTHLLSQAAMHGGEAFAPPHIVNEIYETRTQIQRIEATLRAWGGKAPDDLVDELLSGSVRSGGRLDRNRQAMLARVRATWIDGVLNRSVPKATRIPLALSLSDSKRATQSAAMVLPIVQAFDQFDGAILILGAPGSGKTRLLLELTESLLDLAEQDDNLPMPVVFNLVTWHARNSSLADWLVEQLNRQYDVPRAIAKEWIDRVQITPLLDGLDEVQSNVQEAAVSAINAFRSQYPLEHLVVASRQVNYKLMPKLQLNGTVVIKPLTSLQIEKQLGQNTTTYHLYKRLQQDSSLKVFLETPLLLDIAAKAWASTAQLPQAERGINTLMETYVNVVLRRRGSDKADSQEQTTRWLAAIARDLVANHETIIRPNRNLVTQFSRVLQGGPWHLRHFLDHCTSLGLLHQVGDGYVFVHRVMLEYFAALAY